MEEEENIMVEETKEVRSQKEAEKLRIENIPLELIERSEYNVRSLNIEKDIMSLAKSMDDPLIGLMEPIKVRKKEGKYKVFEGQRRVIAARMLGWDRIPAIVTSEDTREEDDLIRSLIHDTEHMQIDPQDKADVVEKLLKENNNDYRIVAKKLHKAISTIHNWYGYRQVPKEIREAVSKDDKDKDKIMVGVARQLVHSTAPVEEKVKLGKLLTNMRPEKRIDAVDMMRVEPTISSEQLQERLKEEAKLNEEQLQEKLDEEERLRKLNEEEKLQKLNEEEKQLDKKLNEEEKLNEVQLQEKLNEGSISVYLSFNIRFSKALRTYAKQKNRKDFNTVVGDMVAEKLKSGGYLTEGE